MLHLGIKVYHQLHCVSTFSWAKIRKLSFKRRKLLIKLHPDAYVRVFFNKFVEIRHFSSITKRRLNSYSTVETSARTSGRSASNTTPSSDALRSKTIGRRSDFSLRDPRSSSFFFFRTLPIQDLDTTARRSVSWSTTCESTTSEGSPSRGFPAWILYSLNFQAPSCWIEFKGFHLVRLCHGDWCSSSPERDALQHASYPVAILSQGLQRPRPGGSRLRYTLRRKILPC